MKLIVKSTPGALLRCITMASPNVNEFIHSHRPSVVTSAEDVAGFISRGVVKLIKEGLHDSASDADFDAAWLKAGRNDEEAIAAYLSVVAPVFKTPEEEEKFRKAEDKRLEKELQDATEAAAREEEAQAKRDKKEAAAASAPNKVTAPKVPQ